MLAGTPVFTSLQATNWGCSLALINASLLLSIAQKTTSNSGAKFYSCLLQNTTGLNTDMQKARIQVMNKTTCFFNLHFTVKNREKCSEKEGYILTFTHVSG